MISKLSASLLQWSTLLPKVIEECLHNSLSLILIHNIEIFSGLGMRKWLTKSPRQITPRPPLLFVLWFAFSAIHGRLQLLCISYTDCKLKNKIKGGRQAWEQSYSQWRHAFFSLAHSDQYTNSLWSVYKLTLISIQTHSDQYTNTLWSVYKLTLISIQTHSDQYTNTLWSVYKHTLISIQTHSDQYTNTLWSVYKLTLISIQTHSDQYTNSLWSVYKHTLISIQTHSDQYTNTLWSAYKLTLISIQTHSDQYTNTLISI